MVAKTSIYLRLLVVLILLNACSINTGSMNNSSIFRGTSLNATRPYPIDITWKSSLRALDSLKISITKRYHNTKTAVIKGVTVQDNSVKLSMSSTNSNTTRISIRVGVFGDEIISREILRRIDSNFEILRQQNFSREEANAVY